MNAIPYSAARQNLAKTMDQVCDEHEPVIITRRSSDPVVMMSLADYNSMRETEYLLSSPKNAERLLRSIKQCEQGNFQERELLE
ncbi:MAG: hypothetical protein A2X78_02350 [Gammaproteobacteria bacterium GWE2_37_16]|nr:MAG: hypothetical protein A2X78_02350 [Gammaproteobacteria bacterium GWE2_37_16]